MIDQAAALPGEVIERAARVLADSLGSGVQVSGHEVLRTGRSTVARLRLDGGPAASTILKLAGEDRDLLWNEYAGLAFLAGLPSPPASVPAFYGGDRGLGFVLLEDYGAEHSLADVLLRSDAATARTAMLGYVDALLAVHLPTFGRGEEFARLRAEFPGAAGQWTQDTDKTWGQLAGRLPELDAGLDAGPAGPAKDWIGSVLEGRPEWQAFTVNDCCPDNNQVGPDGRVRLFDLEFSQVRHALIDLAYVRTTMPTCWCLRRFPAGLDDLLVDRYRDRLLAERPSLTHADFDTGLVAAAAYLALVNLSWHIDRAAGPEGGDVPYFDERDFHLPSGRQMVLLRLDELAAAADQQPELAPLGELAAQIRQAARTAWGVLEPIPLYPAFS